MISVIFIPNYSFKANFLFSFLFIYQQKLDDTKKQKKVVLFLRRLTKQKSLLTIKLKMFKRNDFCV